MMTFPVLVYVLCLASSVTCTGLLLWSALGIVDLSFNNLFLFFDLVVFPDIDFVPFRHLSALAGIAVLLYGFIWEVD